MHQAAWMEFHVSREARDRYAFDQSLFSNLGTVVFANFPAARTFAQKINEQRDVTHHPEAAVSAGQVNAMALIHEILHAALGKYAQDRSPQAMARALQSLEQTLGREELDQSLLGFVEDFPALAVYRGLTDPPTYLSGSHDGVPNREIILEEMLLLWLGVMNPAYAPLEELFDDTRLEEATAYPDIITGLYDFFKHEPGLNGTQQNLIDLLRAPALTAPDDLMAQLRYIQEQWGFVGQLLLVRMLSSLDLIREETRPHFTGPGPSQVLTFGFGGPSDETPFNVDELVDEPERYSEDVDWMPKLVMIAKSTYVWLDQLSKSYGRTIQRLDQIPDEELDILSQQGFTGLWLIGIWNRSVASQTIKRLCGNPEAVASAYSLLDYGIAEDLGGEAAYENLSHRAWRRGIRLASDMVPNHMGIDSRWVIEHPDWFISVPQPPFPSYSFNGPNVSVDDRVGIYLEDHYYSQSDAAVVFKRVDHQTGSELYIYHGNDGTSMPWNDTAQLNYLDPAVREAVIQAILYVARKFPIIRFDAAMTLAKKHIERLWYPEPGSGGAIASRAEHGLSKADFNAAMPEEFWRDVVDRVAQEVPNTLLLAEAFWMMEGYFVRTLGMHRVYNSAFMNMLKNEENAHYRLSIKNTLEFDPEILKRYVNFQNNPDERTAVEQFGKDDKYFGVCILMVTMPGLPMFGHGQVEGFTEKYGMEYRRAYLDEQPDQHLIERHRREIFPLLHKRYLFANVEHFLFYDFTIVSGVDENVFAYSNRVGDERALVVYHNAFSTAHGWIRNSVSYLRKTGQGDERVLMQKNLGAGLGLHTDADHWTLFRDHITGLEYLRSSQELYEKGLYVELEAFKYQVLLDFREVKDTTGQYTRLAAHLNGRGVRSIERSLHELLLQPIHVPFRELANAGMWHWLLDHRLKQFDAPLPDTVLADVEQKMLHLFEAIKHMLELTTDAVPIARQVCHTLEVMLCLPVLQHHLDVATSVEDDAAVKYLTSQLHDDTLTWGTLFGWLSVYALGQITATTEPALQSRQWIDEWLLGPIMADALRNMGADATASERAVTLIKLLTTHQQWFKDLERTNAQQVYLTQLVEDHDVQQWLGVNTFEGVRYFNRESFEQLLWWLFVTAVITTTAHPQESPSVIDTGVIALHHQLQQWLEASERSGYQLDTLMTGAQGTTAL
ncbi:MAG: alpha-amylase [Herpetosiphonaceae bacterium]|nr:alpha-amylase [Herpetosiphonaceae bacterium]